jgi:hypothetical protein
MMSKVITHVGENNYIVALNHRDVRLFVDLESHELDGSPVVSWDIDDPNEDLIDHDVVTLVRSDARQR